MEREKEKASKREKKRVYLLRPLQEYRESMSPAPFSKRESKKPLLAADEPLLAADA
jgi:hypothetical protein